MSIENFKTILLINLVAISLFLSYSLWTYQPEFNSDQDQKYIQDVPAMTKKELTNLVFPSRMIVHKDNKHIASEQSLYINPVYKQLEQGEFHDFRDISYKIEKDEFLTFMHGNHKAEFIFPTEIPLDVMKSIFSIKEQNMGTYSFNRIIIDLEESNDNDIKTYFVSYDTRRVYEMTLQGLALKDLEDAYDQFITDARQTYFMYKIDNARAVFLPEESVELPRMLYVTSELQEDMFKNSLFTDPRYIKKDQSEFRETYTDGTRLLQIEKATRLMDYMNSSISTEVHLTGGILVQRSVDFVNSHGGWTDFYRFYALNSKKGEIVFRLFANNSYPVFSTTGISVIRQVWGEEELSTYRRPFFKLLLKREDDEKVKLPSGREVVYLLESLPEANLKAIRSIEIGYEMNPEVGMDGEKISAVKLEPVWFISYEHSYKKIEWDKVNGGGDLNGLE